MASPPIYAASLQTFRSGRRYDAIVRAFGQGHLTDNVSLYFIYVHNCMDAAAYQFLIILMIEQLCFGVVLQNISRKNINVSA